MQFLILSSPGCSEVLSDVNVLIFRSSSLVIQKHAACFWDLWCDQISRSSGLSNAWRLVVQLLCGVVALHNLYKMSLLKLSGCISGICLWLGTAPCSSGQIGWRCLYNLLSGFAEIVNAQCGPIGEPHVHVNQSKAHWAKLLVTAPGS